MNEHPSNIKIEKGYVHVYTGNGKGKSTAAFGLAIRAACAGKNVFIGQFVKDMKYSETAITQIMPNIEIEQLGKGCFISQDPKEEDHLAACAAMKVCGEKLSSGSYDVIVLDEIFIALKYQLLEERVVLDAIAQRAPHVDVVLTGRYASDAFINMADLVTEMKEIKHYYHQGVLSRKGIDC